MKKTVISILLIHSFFLFAQNPVQLSPVLISTAGDFAAAPGLSLSYSIGECIVATAISPDLILTQGFQQPSDEKSFHLPDTTGLSSINGLHVYSGITPNGDNHNDYWVIDSISFFPDNTVKIFSQWGNKVWEKEKYSNAKEEAWDGRNQKGEALTDGTYFYVITVATINGKKEKKGWVELTR